MLGTIVNAGAIVLGCAVGLLLRRGIPERVTDAVMKGIGLCVIYIGVSGALEGEKTIAMIIAMAAGGAQLDAGGPGLMFIYLVHVMNGMAGGRIVAMGVFVCVAFAGVTSIINLYEAPVASLQERFGLKRVPATAVIHVIGLAVALCIQAIVSQWMDVVSIYICPLGALLAAVMFFWIGGKKLVLESVNLGARKPIGGWYYPLCKYVYCASVLVALVAGAALGGIG